MTRAYLQNFVAEGEKTLYVYTRGKTSCFRAQPENVAAISNYYSHKNEDGTFDDRVEHMLEKVIESPGIKIMKRLNGEHYNISKDARLRLAALMAVQEYRTPWMREHMEIFTTRMLQSFTKSMLATPGVVEATLVKEELATEEEIATKANELRRLMENGDIILSATPAASLNAMGAVFENLTDIYFKMRWTILESHSAPFIASDCPLHRYYLPVFKEVPARGLFDKRVEVRFPLSSSKMLVLTHDDKKGALVRRLFERGNHRQARKSMLAASQIGHRKVSNDEVERINEHTISMAAQWVFSPIAMADAPKPLAGESKNVRHEFIERPDGSLEFSSIY